MTYDQLAAMDVLIVEVFPGDPPQTGDELFRFAQGYYDAELATQQVAMAMRGLRSDLGWTVGASVAAYTIQGRPDQHQVRIAFGPAFGSVHDDQDAYARLEAKLSL